MERTHYLRREQAQRRTAIFVALFVLSTVLIAGIVGAVAGLVLNQRALEAFEVGGFQAALAQFDPQVAAMAAGAIALVIAVTAIFRLISFGGDGAKVAQSLGAIEVPADTRNPLKQRYLNVVEESAIAANMPVPRAFVLKHEKGINAFAAGADPEHAAIGVTHGALSSLTRSELAGVVAHEMAHIANRDTQLNIRIMALVFGLVAVYVLGRMALRGALISSMGRRSRDARAQMLMLAVGVVVIAVGALGILGGRIMQAAISRQREYLADATGASYTGDPQGLANALKKIGALGRQGRVNNGHAEEARHMMFVNAAAHHSMSGPFSTHPPLIERIRALDPQFDPDTDPVWREDQKTMMREARPWGRPAP